MITAGTGPSHTTIPTRPAAYVRDPDGADEDSLPEHRDLVIGLAQQLSWPVPDVYSDIGPAAQPGSQYAALVEAIASGRHDAVLVIHPIAIGNDLAQIEAFDRHCRHHGVPAYQRYGARLTHLGPLFDVIRDVRHFIVTGDHLRILRHAYVIWDDCEFGAPAINCKRPYGNSDVLSDIARILDVPEGDWVDEDLDPYPEAEWRFVKLHVETALALQIALATGEFRVGHYYRGRQGRDWRRDGS
jgi:hypothetical protein